MKILVDGIPAAGREVTFGLGDAWAVAAAELALDRAPARLAGTVHLKRASAKGQVVVVDVSAQAGAPTECDRCGEPCELAVSVDARLLFAPEEVGGAAYDGLDARSDLESGGRSGDRAARAADLAESGSHPEIELAEDDLDVGWYRGGELDLQEVIGEALALETPPRVVCADVAECDKRTDALLAAARVADGPFAALRALKRDLPGGD